MDWKRSDGHEKLKNLLIGLYHPFYLMNDRAHQINHVIAVASGAVEINEALNLKLDNCILVGAAMVHDLFNLSREDHHRLAGEYIIHNCIDWLGEFSAAEREIMGAAAAEHRASYKGEYFSIYSELVAAADRGPPDPKPMLIRCAVFGVDKCGYLGDRLYQHVIEHMQDKFGTNGYSRYPVIYTLFYEEQLSGFHKTIDSLTKESIDEITGGTINKLAFPTA